MEGLIIVIVGIVFFIIGLIMIESVLIIGFTVLGGILIGYGFAKSLHTKP